MPKSVFQLKKAIEEIMNDVIQKAFSHSINHPQHSDSLNVLIKNSTETTEKLVRRLNEISGLTDDKLQQIQLNELASDLKKKSLLHLSELQKITQESKVS